MLSRLSVIGYWVAPRGRIGPQSSSPAVQLARSKEAQYFGSLGLAF